MWLLINIHWSGNGPNVMQITCKATCKLEPFYEVNRWGTMHIKRTGQQPQQTHQKPIMLTADPPFQKESHGQREIIAAKGRHQAWSRDSEALAEWEIGMGTTIWSALPSLSRLFSKWVSSPPSSSHTDQPWYWLIGQLHWVAGRQSDLIVH